MSERVDKVKPSSVIVEVMVKAGTSGLSLSVSVKSLLLRGKGEIGGPPLEVTSDGRA